MAIGPLESFVFPGVLTQTINEASGVTAAGQIRFPAFVGTSAEEVRVSNFEMVRGSSSISDNLILDEDESSQFTGTEKTLTVQNFPIVTGDGSGKGATSPNSVIVTVNGVAVAVNAVNGLTGQVVLTTVPRAGDIVRANYYFKRRDTYVENEDISDQVDGVNATFKVHHQRIVTGDNSGRSATDTDINSTVSILYDPTPTSIPGDEYQRTVRVIQVTVNGGDSPIAHLDGAAGTFSLVTAPAALATVVVTYFTSVWQDTFDILPAAQVTRLVKVGLSQDTNDFSIGVDCVLAGLNEIHWGNSYHIDQGIFSVGSTPFLDNISASLTDTRVFGRVAAPVTPLLDGFGNPILDSDGNEINITSNKTFVLATAPVDGSGKGAATEDPTDMIAYVGTTWAAALFAGPVPITKVVGNNITLTVAPSQALQEKVYVTYYESLIVDDTWTLTDRVPGGIGVGKYTISSTLHGNGLDVIQTGGTISPVYAGAGTDNTQVDPLKASVERVTVTFDGVGGFTVSSKIGPAFILNGRTGSVATFNQNKGSVGKTYLDPTTGFRVSFSSNTGLFNPGVGDTVIYDIGDPTTSDPVMKLYVTAKASTIRAIPGMNLSVPSTDGGLVDNTGDTVLISTYNKSGNEPAVGDMYYVSFDKEKTDYSTQFLTTMRDVIRLYGPIDINNRLTIAANLAFQNGARAVALKQIQRSPGEPDASVQDYIDGIDSFNEPLPNGLRPSMMQPLSTDPQVHNYLKTSNAIQSSIRYRNERTSIVGYAVGTTSNEVIQSVQGLGTEKVTAIYPDGAIIDITDNFGNTVEYVVDGSIVAAAIAGCDVSPTFDIATPLTNQTISGFVRLYRRLDNVTAALVANAGCTVLEEQTPVIRLLMYLTTDMSNILTRDPRIVEVKHFIQQGLRTVLARFIGNKNLPKLQSQIKDTVGSYFKSLKQSEIIVNFTGVNVTQNAQDPSTVDVVAYYSPVFPLNWIVVTLNLRSSL